jgi:hypothetical protein
MKISTWQDAVPSKFKDIFNEFCNSIDTLDEVIPYDFNTDVAIVWYTNSKVIEEFRFQGKNVITLSPGILSNETVKITINGVLPIDGVDNCRFRKFPKMTDTWVVGEDILICSKKGCEASQKEVDKIQRKLSRVSNRRIDTMVVEDYDYTFARKLHNYWAVISFSEFCSIHSLVQGVPVFTSPDSCTNPISRDIKHIADIEHPYAPDRTEWHTSICHSEWFIAEIATGDVWRYFKATLSTI